MATLRQKEFLAAIERIVARNGGGGVHYTEVAQELGVSKWTAYDTLQRLVNKGYLLKGHDSKDDPSSVGRTRVVFYPTSLGRALASPKSWQKLEEGHRRRLEQEVLELIAQAKTEGWSAMVKQVQSRLASASHPLAFCLYALIGGALLLRLATLASGQGSITDSLGQVVLGCQTALVIFGAILAALAQAASWSGFNQGYYKEALSYLKDYENQARDLEPEEEGWLMRVAGEAIQQILVPVGSGKGE